MGGELLARGIAPSLRRAFNDTQTAREGYAELLGQPVEADYPELMAELARYDARMAWFVDKAVEAGFLDRPAADVLMSRDATAARAVIKTVWDSRTDPADAAGRARQRRWDELVSPAEWEAVRTTKLGTPEGDRIRARLEVIDEQISAEGFTDAVRWELDWPEGTPADEIGSNQWIRHRAVCPDCALPAR